MNIAEIKSRGVQSCIEFVGCLLILLLLSHLNVRSIPAPRGECILLIGPIYSARSFGLTASYVYLKNRRRAGCDRELESSASQKEEEDAV